MDFKESLTLEIPEIGERLHEFAESQTKSGLVVEVHAIHEGMTKNYNYYSKEELTKSLESWFTPYQKPIIKNHDMYEEPLGRVMSARMASESDGTSYVLLQAAINDAAAMEKVADKRYLTGSVGGKAGKALCSVCKTDWANADPYEGLPCKHRRGKVYKGELMYFEMQDIEFKEYSFVNSPADSRSTVSAFGDAVGKDVGDGEESEDETYGIHFFSLEMDKESVYELTESGDVDVFANKRKKDSAPVYHGLRGAFLTTLAEFDTDDESNIRDSDGDIKYADPGFQKDGRKRHLIDTKDHVRATWAHIKVSKDLGEYSPDEIDQMEKCTLAAAKKFGITIDDSKKDSEETLMSGKTDEVVETDETEDILAVAEGLSEDLASEAEDVDDTEEGTEDGQEGEAASDEGANGDDEDNEASAEHDGSEDAEADGQDASEEAEEGSADGDAAEEDELEGQETPKASRTDKQNKDATRESDEADEADEDSGNESDEEESDETDADAELSGDEEERVSALEARITTLTEENTKLRTALKKGLAERVVDRKIELGMVEKTDRADSLTEHLARSASSLADSIRDLSEMAPSGAGVNGAPKVTNESEATDLEEGDQETDDTDDLTPEAKAEDLFVNVLMGRTKIN